MIMKTLGIYLINTVLSQVTFNVLINDEDTQSWHKNKLNYFVGCK